MESVVTEGTAGNAQVAGYAIGGKTGTSEKIDVFDENGNRVDDKIVSFIGVAPINDPQYVVLVALDTPSNSSGYYVSGGVMAAPTVRDVMADILPYLGVGVEYTDEKRCQCQYDDAFCHGYDGGGSGSGTEGQQPDLYRRWRRLAGHGSDPGGGAARCRAAPRSFSIWARKSRRIW